MILVPLPAAGDPSWTDIMTAFGTVGAAVAAVGIAWWSHRQAVRERARSDEREQLAEAYQVRVVQGERPAPGQPIPKPSVVVIVAAVVNGGSYTITGVEVRFSLDGRSLVSPRRSERVSSFTDLPAELRKQGDTSEERAMRGILTPWDAGMRSESDEIGVQNLMDHFALVRWIDRWGQRWEHRLGEVRQIRDDEPWALLRGAAVGWLSGFPAPEARHSGLYSPGGSR